MRKQHNRSPNVIQHTPRNKVFSNRTLLTVSLGTFCDHVLLHTSMSKILDSGKYHVVSFTNMKKSSVRRHTSMTEVPFKTPEYFIKSSELPVADPQSSLVMWTLNHPLLAYETNAWTNDLRTLIDRLLRKFNGITDAIVFYPALPVLAQFPESFFQSTRIHILYYAPAIINSSIPWIFDSMLKDPKISFQKHHRGHINESKCLESHEIFLGRMLLSARYPSAFRKLLERDAYILACWEKASVSIDFKFVSNNVSYMGAIVVNQTDQKNKKTNDIPHRIQQIVHGTFNASKHHRKSRSSNTKGSIRSNNNSSNRNSKTITNTTTTNLRNRRIILVALGSYVESPTLSTMMPPLIEALEKYAMQENLVIIFHNGGKYVPKHSETCVVVNEWITYGAILPFCVLVVFTGSICLQNQCLLFRVPMMYVPVIAEQFFWATNYREMTGVPYYNNRTKHETFDHIFGRAIHSRRVAKYLATISKKISSKVHFSQMLYDRLQSFEEIHTTVIHTLYSTRE